MIVRVSTMKHGRSEAEYLGGTRIRFTMPCGHRETKDYSKGPVSRRMSAEACRRMAHWWSRCGVLAACRRCAREGRALKLCGRRGCPAAWTCRGCSAMCCEHRCGFKVAEGARREATCGTCQARPAARPAAPPASTPTT